MDFDDAGNLIYDKVTNLTTELVTRFTSTYDALGRRGDVQLDRINFDTQAVVNVLNDQYRYDDLGRVDRIVRSGGPTEDDGSGGQVPVSIGQSATFAYDSSGRLSEIHRHEGQLTLTSGNAIAQLVVSSDYGYNDRNQLVSLSHTGPASEALASYGLTYDALNRLDILTITNDANLTSNPPISGSVDYGYDAEGQLLAAVYSIDSSIDNFTQSYDSAGNRTGTGYATDSDNRTTADGTYTYTYDKEGNRQTRTEVASGDVTSYEWDARGRLISVQTHNAAALQSATTYTYDPLDRRVARSVDSNGDGTADDVTQYANDGLRSSAGGAGDHVVAEFDGAGALTHRYLQGVMIDQVLADEQFDAADNSETYWLLGDHQGTIRDIAEYTAAVSGTPASTAVTNHRVYDAFGNLVSETNSSVETDFGFAGRQWDEQADLYFNRARYYDPELGQFISQDPISFAAGDANLYRYVENGPTNATDPSGHEGMSVAYRAEFFSAAIQQKPRKAKFLWNYAVFGLRLGESGAYGSGYHRGFILDNNKSVSQNVRAVLASFTLPDDFGGSMSPEEFLDWAMRERARGIKETGERLEMIQEIAIAVAPGGQLVDATRLAADGRPIQAGVSVASGTILVVGAGVYRSVKGGWKLIPANKIDDAIKFVFRSSPNSAIGFAKGTASTTLDGMKNGGGHAIRHLIKDGTIPNTGSVASKVNAFGNIAKPILENPLKSFNGWVGKDKARIFIGEVDGKKLAIFVATEGPFQGKVITSFFPNAKKLAAWGL